MPPTRSSTYLCDGLAADDDIGSGAAPSRSITFSCRDDDYYREVMTLKSQSCVGLVVLVVAVAVSSRTALELDAGVFVFFSLVN